MVAEMVKFLTDKLLGMRFRHGFRLTDMQPFAWRDAAMIALVLVGYCFIFWLLLR